jgi:hypothetical protein
MIPTWFDGSASVVAAVVDASRTSKTGNLSSKACCITREHGTSHEGSSYQPPSRSRMGPFFLHLMTRGVLHGSFAGKWTSTNI